MPLRPTALFYLGLFPIVLLLWAWADSLRTETRWEEILDDNASIAICLDRSAFHLRSTRALQPLPAGYLRKHWSGYRWGKLQRRKPSGVTATPWFVPFDSSTQITSNHDLSENRWTDFESKDRTIPFWLILAAYLPLWLAFSYWHARRKTKRHQQSLPPAQPQTD